MAHVKMIGGIMLQNESTEVAEMLASCLQSGNVALTILPQQNAYNVRNAEHVCLWADDLPTEGETGVLKALTQMVDPIQRGTFSRAFTLDRLRNGVTEVIVRMGVFPFGLWRVRNVKPKDNQGNIVLMLERIDDASASEKKY